MSLLLFLKKCFQPASEPKGIKQYLGSFYRPQIGINSFGYPCSVYSEL